MSYDGCFRILRSGIYALVIALVAIGAPVAYGQENGTPGSGGPNFAIYPRLLSSSNPWSAIQREPPCFPANTSGTITLTLNDCSFPTNVRKGGSPAYWQLNLSGNSTLVVTGIAVGQVFRIDIVANGFTLALPSSFVLPPSNPVVSGNSFIACEVHDITTIWCPGGILAGLVATATWTVSNPTTSGTTGGGATSQSITLSLTSGHKFIGAIGNLTGGTPTSITSTGTGSVGSCAALDAGAQQANFALWMCSVTGTGSTTVTVNFSPAVSAITFAGYDLASGSGTITSEGVGNFSTPSTSPFSVSGTGTTVNTNDFIVSSIVSAACGAFTAGSGYTQDTSNASLLMQHQIQSATGTPSATATGPNCGDVMNIAALHQ